MSNLSQSQNSQSQRIQWQCARFHELTGLQVYRILKARCEVFIIEQNCVYLDVDGQDLTSLHLIGWTQDQQVAAYLRILPPHTSFAEPSLGRVLSSAPFRGTGIGRILITEGLNQIASHYPEQPIKISAQAYLREFYASFGFISVSDHYLEDDIEHVDMLRPASIIPITL